MKIRKLRKLTRESVGAFNARKKVTTLSAEELKSVIGGASTSIETHAHYNYSSCTADSF